jgi:hypothetical protein
VAGEQRRLEQAAELGGAATVVPDAAAAAAAAPAAASGRDAPAAGGKARAAGKAAVKPGRAAAELQQAGSRRQPGSTVSHLATASLESEEAIEDTAQLQLKHTQEAATPAGQHAAPAQPELAGTQEEASGQAGGSDDARGGQADGATAMCMDVDEKEAGEGSSAGSTAAKAATTEPPAAAQQQAKTPPANKAGERQAAAHAQRESGGGQDAAAAAGGAQEQGPPTAAKPLAATATSSALPAASPEARKAAAGGGASLDGALVEAAPDGTLSFRFDVAPSSGAAGGGPGQRSAADLARERLLGRLPPGAAQGLQQRLERMSLGAGGSEAAGEAPAGRPSPLGTLSPSTRGGSAPLGNTPRPAAASSGDWQPPRPPPRKPRQRQLRAGDVSLPRPADEPPPAADAAAAAEREPAPLAPPPPPAADQAELLHLFSSPAAAQPLPGQGRSQAGAYTGVAMRGSLPGEPAFLLPPCMPPAEAGATLPCQRLPVGSFGSFGSCRTVSAGRPAEPHRLLTPLCPPPLAPLPACSRGNLADAGRGVFLGRGGVGSGTHRAASRRPPPRGRRLLAAAQLGGGGALLAVSRGGTVPVCATARLAAQQGVSSGAKMLHCRSAVHARRHTRPPPRRCLNRCLSQFFSSNVTLAGFARTASNRQQIDAGVVV